MADHANGDLQVAVGMADVVEPRRAYAGSGAGVSGARPVAR